MTKTGVVVVFFFVWIFFFFFFFLFFVITINMFYCCHKGSFIYEQMSTLRRGGVYITVNKNKKWGAFSKRVSIKLVYASKSYVKLYQGQAVFCFLDQETLHLLLSTGCFQERIRECFYKLIAFFTIVLK